MMNMDMGRGLRFFAGWVVEGQGNSSMKDSDFHSVNILSCKNEAGQRKKEHGRSLVSLETTHSRETEEKRLTIVVPG